MNFIERFELWKLLFDEKWRILEILGKDDTVSYEVYCKMIKHLSDFCDTVSENFQK